MILLNGQFYFYDLDNIIYCINADGSNLTRITSASELGIEHIDDISFVGDMMMVYAYPNMIAVDLDTGRKVRNPGIEDGEVLPLETAP